jgi:SAM-dependent methyltransferase
MDPNHLDELMVTERNYWWHAAKRELVAEILELYFPPPARLIEGGIGAGGNLVVFQELGYQVTGFDAMPAAVHHCRKLGVDNVQIHDLQEPWPVEPGSARVVVMLDVIEHVADPVKVLRHAATTLDRRGGIVVTVPAGPYLMGPWDRMLGHHRRYTTRVLKAQADKAGLRVAWLSHWNAFSLPAALVVRITDNLFRCQRRAEFPPVSPAVNSLLIKCARLERRWLRKMPIPCGLSLIGVLVP